MAPRPRSLLHPAAARAAAGARGLACAVLALAAAAVLVSCGPTRPPADPWAGTVRWFKGDIHVHSRWSDGVDFPEMVATWYREHGYHFLVTTDHNRVQEGEMWVGISNKKQAARLAAYRERWGDDWVRTREQEDPATGKPVTVVRARALDEYRGRVEDGGWFILIPGEEITRRCDKTDVHLNALNVATKIPARKAPTVRQTIAQDLEAVAAQEARTGAPTLATLNHPNWSGAVPVEDFSAVEDLQFFEVSNSHPSDPWNRGDDKTLSADRLWDVALVRRLADLGLGLLYGVAADDSHDTRGGSGRAFVMVRAAELAPGALIEAMKAGDFYASTGVCLKDVRREGDDLVVEVDPEPEVTYRIQFVGTLRTCDRSREDARDAEGQLLPPTQRYSADIGKVLKEVAGTTARYTPTGQEYYVRARVVSSREIPLRKEDREKKRTALRETAWTQPVVIEPPEAE